MEYLNSSLPIIIYILIVILLVLLIIFMVKALKTMKKVDEIVDNVDDKVNSLNGIFSVIDLATDKISIFSDKLIDGLAGVITKVFKKRKNKKIKEEETNE